MSLLHDPMHPGEESERDGVSEPVGRPRREQRLAGPSGGEVVPDGVEDAGDARPREAELRLGAVPRGRQGSGESALEAWRPRGRRYRMINNRQKATKTLKCNSVTST